MNRGLESIMGGLITDHASRL